MKTWDVYWSPEGKKIATVQANTAREAIRQAPEPYNKYLGEIYAEKKKEEKRCRHLRTGNGEPGR